MTAGSSVQVRQAHQLLAAAAMEAAMATEAAGRQLGVRRVDGTGCQCSGCVDGVSCPLERAGTALLTRMLIGQVANATGFSSEQFAVVLGPGRVVQVLAPQARAS